MTDLTYQENVVSEPTLSERVGVKTSFWDYLSLFSNDLLRFPLQIISAVLATRILGPDGYGHIAIFGMVVGLGTMIGVDWTAGSVLRFGREEFDLRRKINQTFWARNIIMAPGLLIWLAVVFLFKDSIANYIGMPVRAVGLLAASVFLGAINNYLYYILQASHRMKAYAAVQVIWNVLSVVSLCLIFFKVFPWDFLTVIIVGILFGTIATIIGILLVPRHILLPIQTNRSALREVFLFSYPVILGSVAAYIVNWVDVAVIKEHFAASEVGSYQLAYRTFALTLAVIMTSSTLTTPILISFLANGREDLILRYSTRFVPQGLLIWSAVVGVALALSPILFRLAFSSQFITSAFYFQFLALGLSLNAVTVLCNGILMAYKLIKVSMAVNVLMALINLSGDLLLVPAIGPVGAAISTSAAICTSAVLYILICQKQLQRNLCWQLILVLPVLLSFGVSLLVSGPGAPFLAIGVTLAATYYLAKAIHLFKHEDATILDYIQMPVWLRKVIVVTIDFLASKNQSNSSRVTP